MGLLKIFWPRTELSLIERNSENNSLLRLKNTKEIIIKNHKGTRMAKDGDDEYGVQTSSLQNRRDFCVFKGTGAKARRARSASCVRGEVR